MAHLPAVRRALCALPLPRGLEAVDSGRASSLQRAAYAAFVQVDSEVEMSCVLRRKFNILFACNWHEEFGARLVGSIAELPAQSAAHALRFFSNAWPTSARLHLEVEECLFCRAPRGDIMRHYLVCEPLLRALAGVCRLDGPRDAGLARLGFLRPDCYDVRPCVVATMAYLAMRGQQGVLDLDRLLAAAQRALR